MDQDLRTDRVLAAVRSVTTFRGLAAGDQRRVAELAALRVYQRGELLWEEGDPADHFTVIVKGRVKVVRRTEAADVILEIFGAGEPVGAIAVYNVMPYPAAAVALEPVTLLMLPRRDYFELMERNPDFTRALMRELTKLVLALTRKLEEVRGQRVDVRIAQLFLSLAERMGESGEGGTVIHIRLTRQEIADLVGTTVESAIRVLSRWGRQGLVITRDGEFVIPSRERLTALSEGAPDVEA
jgi:CRP-like cAMP-binding protein